MGYKSTLTVTKELAIGKLMVCIPSLSNDVLADLLTVVADSGEVDGLSHLNNFNVEDGE